MQKLQDNPPCHKEFIKSGRHLLSIETAVVILVRKERLELSRLAALEPKSSASTNSATFACGAHNPKGRAL